jgi:hypothetical protein
MTPGKCAARARFEISLERHRPPFVRELHQYIDFPWFVVGGVWTLAGIVSIQARTPIPGNAGIVTRSITQTSQDVHATFSL